jgi:sec-independent protein translocase protein TatA
MGVALSRAEGGGTIDHMTPGVTQILIVALVIILLFGASRLSSIGKGLGEGVRNFKKGVKDVLPEEGEEAKAPEDDTQTTAHSKG